MKFKTKSKIIKSVLAKEFENELNEYLDSIENPLRKSITVDFEMAGSNRSEFVALIIVRSNMEDV